MRSPLRFLLVALVALAACAAPQAPASPPVIRATSAQKFASGTLPPPIFVDRERRAKLTTAFPEIEEMFRAWMQDAKVPGVALAIVVDGDTVFEKGLGVRDLESRAPVDPDSLFRIASMTKSFTALAVLKLRDEGKLSLDAPAEKYLPELAALAYPTRDSARITVRDLLTHGAGFPEDNPWGDRQLALGDAELGALIATGLSFSHAPNTEFEYSNLGFMLLGRMVARVAGTTYEEYVTREILHPLGMRATTYDVARVPKERLTAGYRVKDGGHELERPLGDGAGASMGGLFSSAREMARYAAFHLAAWPPRDDPDAGPVRRSSVREVDAPARFEELWVGPATRVKPARATVHSYGFGMGTRQECDVSRILAHTGGLPGYGSVIMMFPEHGVAIIGLANATYAAPARVARKAFLALAATGGLTPRKPQPAPALLAAKGTIEEAIQKRDPAILATAAADNFFLDTPIEQRRAELDKLAAHGACRSEGALDAENALRGEFHLACEKGWIDAFVTLSPASPPRIQHLALSDGYEPSADLVKAAQGVLASDRAEVLDMAVSRGACKLGRAERGDGKTESTFRVACARGNLLLRVTLDASGKVKTVSFDQVPGERCGGISRL